MDSHLRAAHADRQAVAAALQHHTAAGRLTLDEYDQRVTAAWQAITVGDLAALTADLPTETTRQSPARLSPPIPLAWLAAIVVLALLGAALVGGAANAQPGDLGDTMTAMMGMCH
jgi:hypothetical protein